MTEEVSDDAVIDYLSGVQGIVEQYGWAVQGVIGSFYYTVGLFRAEHGWHPELVITVPLAPAVAQGILNAMGENVRDGRVFELGPVEVLHGDVRSVLVEVGDVRHEEYPLSIANQLYGRGHPRRVEALQLVIADKRNFLPWEDGYSHEGLPQPLLGHPLDGRG